jgi:protoporphyrinogen oxidase
LAEAGHRVFVVDPSEKAGGLAGGIEVGGRSVEIFYHHLFRSDKLAQKWIRDMGLGDRLEFLPATMGLYSSGHLYRFGTPGLASYVPTAPPDRSIAAGNAHSPTELDPIAR